MSEVYAMEPAAFRKYVSEAERIREAHPGEDLEAVAEIDGGPFAFAAEGTGKIIISGVLSGKRTLLQLLMGQAPTLTYPEIIAAIDELEADPSVQSLELFINSAGGAVSGLDVVAERIAKVKKPVKAVVQDEALSAGYYLASQAGTITGMTRAATFGSIGVVVETYDADEALRREGVEHRVFTSTDAPEKRLDLATEEGREKLVAVLDKFHSIFAGSVAEGRGTTVEDVNKNFGRGGIVFADDAWSSGMIDSIGFDVDPARTGEDLVSEYAHVPNCRKLISANVRMAGGGGLTERIPKHVVAKVRRALDTVGDRPKNAKGISTPGTADEGEGEVERVLAEMRQDWPENRTQSSQIEK